MLALIFDWLEQKDNIGCNILPARMTCAELCCQIVWEHFPQLCSIFVPFHFYLIMTVDVPCLDNIFMVLLISALAKNGATKPIFLDSGSPRGRGGVVRVWAWFVIIV